MYIFHINQGRALWGKEEWNMFNYGISGLFGRSSYGSFYSALGDYSSIRSGSYRKLLGSYYAKANKNTASKETSKKDNTYLDRWNLSNSRYHSATYGVRKEADELTESAKALTNQGYQSLFAEKVTTTTDAETGVKTTTKGYDTDAIAKAVDSFVSDYNDVVKAGTRASDSNVVRNTAYMTKLTDIYKRSLSEVGITVGRDQTLSVDTEKLKSAGIDSLKRVFNGTTSFAAQTANRANSISQAASRAASSSAAFYGSNGGYNNFYSNLYSSFNWFM